MTTNRAHDVDLHRWDAHLDHPASVGEVYGLKLLDREAERVNRGEHEAGILDRGSNQMFLDDLDARAVSPSVEAGNTTRNCDIRTVQELLGHRDVSTTMMYTHVLHRGGLGVKSPADQL